MEATIDRQNLYSLVRLRGELDLYNAGRLREILGAEIEHGASTLVVDLSGISYVDSSGIGALIFARTAMEKAGGKFCLAALQAAVLSVFRMTRLLNFFAIFDSVALAAEATQAGALSGRTPGAQPARS
ncbi:MAG: STAS domain-containing protein [Leptospirales bacterium]|nr:STAS domain-containing protein [Leptospirales bacterium]